MEKFTSITSRVLPLPIADVDTDMIIPANFLTSVSKAGYGENVFRRLRDQDSNFPFNLPQYEGAEILVADDNFGCGSSREHAVWALMGWGIRVVIAKSFADIFTSNSLKNGLVLATLPDEKVDGLLRSASRDEVRITVDLPTQEVRLPGDEVCSFEFDPFRKHCIVNGLDDIDYIMSHRDAIAEFRKAQDRHRYFRSGTSNH